MLVFLDAVRGKCEDQILPLIFAVLLAINVLNLDSSGYVFHTFPAGLHQVIQIFIRILIRLPVAFYSFRAEAGIIHVGVQDLQVIKIHILSSYAVHILIDGFDLVIGHMEILRKSVAGNRVGSVQTSRRYCIRQINPEKIFLPEFGAAVYSIPFFRGDHRTVFYGLSCPISCIRDMIRDMIIVYSSLVIKNGIKIKRFQGRNVCVVFFICSGRCGSGILCGASPCIFGTVRKVILHSCCTPCGSTSRSACCSVACSNGWALRNSTDRILLITCGTVDMIFLPARENFLVAGSIVMMAFRLFFLTGQNFSPATVVMLMLFDSAPRIDLQCDGR